MVFPSLEGNASQDIAVRRHQHFYFLLFILLRSAGFGSVIPLSDGLWRQKIHLTCSQSHFSSCWQCRRNYCFQGKHLVINLQNVCILKFIFVWLQNKIQNF